MSARMIGTILLFLVSEGLGVCYGEWSFKLFAKMIPPVAITSFNMGAAHVTLLGSGAVLGLAIFIVTVVSTWLSGMFQPRVSAPAAPAAPAAPTRT
jgi:hypothetical protein